MNQKQEIREHWRQFRRQIQETGDLLRKRKMPELTEELFSLYEKTGNRLLYENEYFERRRFLTVFGLLSIWYERQEDICKLEEVIREICREETWALPAHVNRQEADWRRTVDLFASETGQTLAQIVSLLGEKLDQTLARQVRELVIDRLLDSYLEKEEGSWRWETMKNNWVAVCAGSLGSMALYLLTEEPQKQKQVLERVLRVLPEYLDGMYEDGACPEGLSYFTYGMVYYTGFARQLEEASEGKICLMDQEKVRRIAHFQQKCYLDGGLTVSFSDGSAKDRFRLGLTCCLAGRWKSVEIPELCSAMEFEDDHCYRFMGNYQDDVWVQEYLEQAPDSENHGEWFSVLPDAQWAIWKQNGIGAALKGGHNAEPHNHNDVGSFLITAGGEVFLSDLGCGEYTKAYFAEETRYQILCNRSLGHSVPLLNGKEQGNGTQFAAEEFLCSAPGTVSLELGGAYPGKERCRRTFSFGKEETKITVTDEAKELGEEGTFAENLVTQIKPSVIGKRLCLTGQKGVMTIDIQGADTIEVKKEIFCNHRGKPEDVWQIQWIVQAKDGEAACRMQFDYQERISESGYGV